MSSHTVHHPPTGEILYPAHEMSMQCECKPERTVENKRRQSRQGYNTIVHIWHKSLKGAGL